MSTPDYGSRKIIHVDMDCFYAAVEMRDNPNLRNIPLAIGGQPGSRGVLCTANYEARKFGVRSAMASSMAVKLCPKLTIIPTNMSKYKEASDIIRGVYEKYTDLIEPLSLDEAYLDVTDCKLFSGSATLIARDIKNKIKEATGLVASAGVAPNKFLAKVASDWKKPDGLFVIRPNDIQDFVQTLPVECINGVGKVTAAKMHAVGIKTCGDIGKKTINELTLHFGKMAPRYKEYSVGVDHRAVETDWIRKSLSLEHTFESDLPDYNACIENLPSLYDEFKNRLLKFKAKDENDSKIQKMFVKIKFHDFQSVTVEKSKEPFFYDDLWKNGEFNKEMDEHIKNLTRIAFERGNRPVRLLGFGVRFDNLTTTSEESSYNNEYEQLTFFEKLKC